MAIRANFPNEGFPYELATLIKEYHEDELFLNDNLGMLSMEELVDDNQNRTSKYIISAGIYQPEIVVEDYDIYEYSEIPEYLEVPHELLQRFSEENKIVLEQEQNKIRISVHITERFYATSREVRPLVGGTSCMHYEYNEAGTLGGKVQLSGEDGNFFISNWHVLVGSNGRLNDPILQPGRRDGGKYDKHKVAQVVWYRLDEHMDLAIAKVYDEINISSGIITIPINGISKPVVDMNVVKYGRTTERTTGKILKLNCTREVLSDEYPNNALVFKNQILCDLPSARGDSGSLLLESGGNNVVGILFAASESNTLSVANTLDLTIPIGNNGEHASNLKKEPKIESFN